MGSGAIDKPDLYSLLKQLNAIGGIAQIGQPGFCLLMALWQKANELNWAHQFTMTNTELLYRSGYNSESALNDKRNNMSQNEYFTYLPPKNRRQCGTYIMNYNLIDSFAKRSSERSIPRSISSSISDGSVGSIPSNIIKPNQTNEKYKKFTEIYPNMKKLDQTRKNWDALIKKGVDPDLLIKAAENYVQYCQDNDTEQRYMIYSSNFLGRHAEYKDFVEYTPAPQKPDGKDGDINWLS